MVLRQYKKRCFNVVKFIKKFKLPIEMTYISFFSFVISMEIEISFSE